MYNFYNSNKHRSKENEEDNIHGLDRVKPLTFSTSNDKPESTYRHKTPSTLFNVCKNICTKCNKGYYSSDGNSCRRCEKGKVIDKEGATSCVDCQKGKYHDNYNWGKSYPDPTANKCIFCPHGQYSDEPGLFKCKQCPMGKRTTFTGASSSASCHYCGAGEIGNGGSRCDRCAHGKYKPEHEKAKCLDCPKKRPFTTKVGSKKEDDCLACNEDGFYSHYKECRKCPYGYYILFLFYFNCKIYI